MANDPNRDLLLGREDNNYKTGKGSSEKIDHQILAKLSRCELEDKFLRLLDEQTHLKKLVNCQEEKIKRLGTKLLRLIGEKKNGRKSLEQTKETEDLHLRIIELEHENYALKDKNTVLKQQVATHSRHITVQRSPIRSAHTSPLMSIRQSAPPVHAEVAYECKNVTTDAQLLEAENHIKKLNEEIKSLHNKIDFLQQNLEKNNLDNKKTKVTENIELIRLQRSLKQQAIQIAALQAQIKNSEKNQKKLKEELIRAHNENEEALHLISVKQGEILTLGSKLEEKNLNRLEEDELRQRINDLTLERDFLKERSDFLMKTVTIKGEETEQICELKRVLAEERQKKEELEDSLRNTRRQLENIRNINTERSESSVPDHHVGTTEVNDSSEIPLQKNENLVSIKFSDPSEDSSFFSGKSGEPNQLSSLCDCLSPSCAKNSSLALFETNAEAPESKEKPKKSQEEGKYKAEKMKLERELQYMREMLRSQTSRCEAQQTEISRLMYELRVNDHKCNDTLRKLDLHLKIFQNLEMRSRKEESSSNQREAVSAQADSQSGEATPSPKTVKREPFRASKAASGDEESSRTLRESSDHRMAEKKESTASEKEIRRRSFEGEPKKRFVDHVFLDSSDDESEKVLEKESLIRKLAELEDKKNTMERRKEFQQNERKGGKGHDLSEGYMKMNSSSNLSRFASDPKIQFQDVQGARLGKHSISQDNVNAGKVRIGILWFKINAASFLWKNENIKFLFVDFSFLDVYGEDTETPESLPKPRSPDEKCEFNFSKVIDIGTKKKEILVSLVNKPDMDLVVFKLVTDSEDFDKSNEYECEDIGVAVVTVKEFMENSNKGPFVVQVKDVNYMKEVVGTLLVEFDTSPGIFEE